MKKALRNGAVCVAVSVLAWGCIGVHGTVRLEHVYEGAAPEAAVPAAVAEAPAPALATPAVPAAPVQPAVAVAAPAPVAPAPAVRKADRIELEVTRDARMQHHSSVRDDNAGRAARLRVRNIDRGSAEVILMDFDRSALRAFVKKYEGQSFSGKLVLDVREVQQGPADVEVCTLDAAHDWNEGASVQSKAKPGEVTASEAQAGMKKWVTPKGDEVALLKDLIYQDGVIQTVLNSHTVSVGSDHQGQKVEMPLDEKFIRHFATGPHVRGMVLFTRHADARVDFFGRVQRQKGAVLVVETK